MESQRFDRFAQLVGTNHSRRAALRVAAAGLVGAVMLDRAPRPATAAIKVCKERFARKGYKPSVNGCGASGWGWTVPDSYRKASFTQACNRHDRCYGTCNKDRNQCDRAMRDDLEKACKKAYSGRDNEKVRKKCFKRAKLYYDVVRDNGDSAYQVAQSAACVCCPKPRKRCGNTCCPEGRTCHNPERGLCCPPGKECGSRCCSTPCYSCVNGQCEWDCAGVRDGACGRCNPDGVTCIWSSNFCGG